MKEEKMDALIDAIRFLKMYGKSYQYIIDHEAEIRILLDLQGLDGSNDSFFELVKKAMKLV